MSFLNKILNRAFPTNDKFYTGEADPIPESDGAVAGVTRSIGKHGGVSLKHQFVGEGSDQTPSLHPTKKVEEFK